MGPNNDDRMIGGSNNDLLRPNWGADHIIGDSGNDILTDGESVRGAHDVLIGGTGDDVLVPFNHPAGQDLVVCSAGRDVAYVDQPLDLDEPVSHQ